ncbi:MAG: polymer-forming cytoskeletal protein [Desulfosarcina sp.]|nr:polymer-forming cytoskeletal protein [Desulfobacterales bacterium]
MADKTKNISIVDKGLTVDGTLSTTGRLIVKGTIKGTLDGDVVIVSEDGTIYAETNVASMTIGGVFEGNIKASRELVVLSTGKCTGKVECKDLVVECGGVLNAEVTCVTGSN